jgi:hypothetical protein
MSEKVERDAKLLDAKGYFTIEDLVFDQFQPSSQDFAG